MERLEYELLCFRVDEPLEPTSPSVYFLLAVLPYQPFHCPVSPFKSLPTVVGLIPTA
jgi:hypothetical protein